MCAQILMVCTKQILNKSTLLFVFIVSDPIFHALLGGIGDLPPRKYTFRRVQCNNDGGSFSDMMISGCSAIGNGFKPICDNPSFCKYDARSLYIGQQGFMSNQTARGLLSKFLHGWSDIMSHWNGACLYAGEHLGGRARCDIGILKFENGRRVYEDPLPQYSYMCGKSGNHTGVVVCAMLKLF